MILECPACNNRYLVDRRAIGEAGRTVRCAKCRNEWHATPPEPEDAPPAPVVEDAAPEIEAAIIEEVPLEPMDPEVKPIPQGSSVPALATKKQPKPWALISALAASFLLFALVAGIYFRPLVVQALPASAKIYTALGMYETNGVVMADLSYNKEAIELRDRHHISGYLVNGSGEDRPLPAVNIVLYGSGDLVLRKRELTESHTLKPGESKTFSHTLESSADGVKRIVVELGSPLELKLR